MACACADVPLVGDTAFAIRDSDLAGARRALVSPDTATCADCLREIHDPADRRYLHPFINCTSCGPRFTIVESVPYDRSRTTMAPLSRCAPRAGPSTPIRPTGASTRSRWLPGVRARR